jgi:hypothetical protein
MRDLSQGRNGLHYANVDLIADPALDHRKPEILLYESQADGTLRLVAIEYFVLEPGRGRRRGSWGKGSRAR